MLKTIQAFTFFFLELSLQIVFPDLFSLTNVHTEKIQASLIKPGDTKNPMKVN